MRSQAKPVHVAAVEEWMSTGWFAAASRRMRWLVGVSGGVDSVVLLRALRELGFGDVVVCHADHGLRGLESVRDMEFVARLADELGYRFDSEKLPVRARMKERGEALETAARQERLEFFARCAKRWRCRRILLAHHLDDQAETVLWNLLRGSYGAKGMEAVKEMCSETGGMLVIHRPLLEISKKELRNWLVSRGGTWCEDESNARPVAVRNRLRAEILPLLAEISGRDPAAALGKLAGDFREMADYICQAAAEWQPLDPQGRLHLSVLRKMPPLLRREAVRAYLAARKIAVSRVILEQAESMVHGGEAAFHLPGGRRFRRRQGRMFVE